MRQHGDDGADEISAVAALLSLAVEGGVGLYIGAHIGDVHSHAQLAIFQQFEGEGVVEVLRIIGVDGEGKDIATV